MLDPDTMLDPLSANAPCGEDLEYDLDFNALELAIQPGEERAMGDAIIPAEAPDYDKVRDMAVALLARTKDLRVAVFLAHAVLHTRGLPEFEQVLGYIRGCLEDYWEDVHPQLDAEDDDDPTMRVNAVLGLANRATVLQALRLAPLTDSRAFGRFNLRDLQVASGEISPSADMDNVPAAQTISAAFQDEDPARLAATVAAVGAIKDHLSAITEVFTAQIGSLGPELDPLEKMISDLAHHLAPYTDITPEQTVADAPAPDNAAPANSAPHPAGVGAINGPKDVVRALDRIMEYYARSEPSSPLPILLGRARRLVSADFVTIMKDMAPLGVENIALIGGLKEDEDDD